MFKRINWRIFVIFILLITLITVCSFAEFKSSSSYLPLDATDSSDEVMIKIPSSSEAILNTEIEILPDETITETDTESTVSEPEDIIPETSIPSESIPPEPSPEKLFWEACASEYPIATEIWLTMKSYGWSDAACAGIMGNIMREVGGDTLKSINPNLYNKSKTHYGLCQWSSKYYPDIQPTANWTPSVEEQLTFLRYTILNQKKLSFNYGFTEDYLINATSYKEVAKIFCDKYERPNGTSYKRELNAETAWKYFVENNPINN